MHVRLTADGELTLAEAIEVHASNLDELVTSKLTGEERARLEARCAS